MYCVSTKMHGGETNKTNPISLFYFNYYRNIIKNMDDEIGD